MSGLITGPNFQTFFHKPDAVALGTMVAVLEIGAFSKHRFIVHFHMQLLTSICFSVTSVAAGRVGDMIGRRMTLFFGALVFTIGGAVQTFTPGYGVMVVGRIVSGFGVGLLS